MRTSTPTSVTGRCTSKHRAVNPGAYRQSGFTLLEILVVLFVIGIVLTIAVLRGDLISADNQLEKSGDRLLSLIELAHDESTMQNREYGLYLTLEGYEFAVLDNFAGQWLAFPQDDIFRPRNLPEDIEFQLLIEEQAIQLFQVRLETDIDPHIILYSSGEQTPFELRIARRYQDEAYVITGQLDGELEEQKPDDDD